MYADTMCHIHTLYLFFFSDKDLRLETSDNEIESIQSQRNLRLTATLQCPALALGMESSYWSITTFSQAMVSVKRQTKHVRASLSVLVRETLM